MGERDNAFNVFVIRFLLCVATGWFGIDSLRRCRNITELDSLRNEPYDPNIIPAQQLVSAGGVFLFFWSLGTLPSICHAHGGALIVLELVDFIGIAVTSVGFALQSKFIPHNLNGCIWLSEWEQQYGQTSLFFPMAAQQTNGNVYNVCKPMVLAWALGIAILVFYGLAATWNLLCAIREIGSSSCYWLHNSDGKRRKYSLVVIIACLPLFVAESMLELFWKMIPTKRKIKHRYSQRHDQKIERYKKLEQKMVKSCSSPQPASESGLVLRRGKASNPSFKSGKSAEKMMVAVVDKKVTEDVREKTDSAVEIAPPAATTPIASPSSNTYLTDLPWHLIVNDILPYLHHVDILNLLLTSKSVQNALLLDGSIDRKLIFHQTCQPLSDNTYPLAAFPGSRHRSRMGSATITPTTPTALDDILPSSSSSSSSSNDTTADSDPAISVITQLALSKCQTCFGCAIPICPNCSSRRELTETPITVHTRTCKPICPDCFHSKIAYHTGYHDRRNAGPCLCGHNLFMQVMEGRTAGSDDTSHTDMSIMACWSWSGAGGVMARGLCRNCEKLSCTEVKKMREDRFRRKLKSDVRRTGFEGDGDGEWYLCRKCGVWKSYVKPSSGGDGDEEAQQKDQRRKWKRKRKGKDDEMVVFWACKQCEKECRFVGHDQWVVEDRLGLRMESFPVDIAVGTVGDSIPARLV